MEFFHKSFILYLFFTVSIVVSFSPDTSPFDMYGLKLASNDVLLVESLASDSSFFLRLAPFTYSLSCTIGYNDSNHYIFSVAVNRQAIYNDTIRFVFIGINMETDISFIGSLTYSGITGDKYIATVKSPRKSIFPCTGWQTNDYRTHQFEQFVTDEIDGDNDNDFFVVTVSRTGQFAYAFTNKFLLIYDFDKDIVSNQLGNMTWPDTSFLPYAVDISSDFLIVVIGYVGDTSTQYIPCAYLLNISNSTFNVLDTWLYSPSTNTSWQASLTNQDADIYAEKYDISVSINDVGDEVLFGIQITNSIILININRTNQKFGSLSQMLSNGKAIGMGKSVGWIDTNLIMVLVNTYSLNYVWSSSQIFAYNITVFNNFSVTSVFPNIQQTLSPTFGPILLSLVVTQNGTVVMLDSQGNYYILLPSSAGSVSDSSSGRSSSSSKCIAGTYTSETNVFPCFLCPSGTTTNGLVGQSSCVSCTSDAFCPLGSSFGNIISSSPLLTNINQRSPYPISPQSIRFDNILMQNMFTIHGSQLRHCLLISPIFWAIIVISFGLFIWIIMFIIKHYVTNPLGKKTHQQMKRFLKKTDLIGEGELVAGGLFSFAIIVLISFAYTFSTSYLNRYPIEQINGGANFACDQTLINAQFSSGLMSISIPPNDDEEPIFELLDAQPLTLYIDFINTVFNCTDITVSQIKDIVLPITISSCNNTDSTASLSLLLPSHTINLQVVLSGTNTIGGLRIGLEGPGVDIENETLEAAYSLRDLVFSQVLFVDNRLLTQQPSCSLQITKLINRTYSLSDDGKTQLSALWLPTYSGNLDEMFVDESEYNYATSSSTLLTLTISETSYYILNTQRPITDEDEVIFTNLLFTILCLEIFGLGFLIFKLIIIPLVKWIFVYCRQTTSVWKSFKNKVDIPEDLITRM